ncbi:hypothetical protein, partial [Allobacillus sp. SKP2-8]|uniref:hypothetical protein n=1 Tax=Allobacillus sp. SKP2-8 TaxID=1955271 RepID=UPI001C8FC9D6
MNEAQLTYINNNKPETLGTIFCIQSKKPTYHTTLIFFDQITAKVAAVERHEQRSSKDMINKFIF